MKRETQNLRVFVQMSLLVAIMIVLSFTPLGYIPLPGLNATTMHIPVILGACLLGPKIGGFLGFLFGVTSMVHATVQPNLTSFVFSPFVSFGPHLSGNWTSLIVAIVPRILIGVVTGYVFLGLRKLTNNTTVALLVAGIAGSLTNTIGVLGFIYLFFGSAFSMAIHKPEAMLFTIIVGIVMSNGLAEAAIAAVVNTALYKALATAFKSKITGQVKPVKSMNVDID